MAKKSKKEKAPKPQKVRRGKLAMRDAIAGYCFVAPWVIGVILLVARPMIESARYSMSTVRNTPNGLFVTFTGVENYRQLWLNGVTFMTELVAYISRTILAVPVIVVFALIIAILLNGKIKCKGLFRLIFFLPVIIASGPVMGMLVDQGAGSISTLDTSVIENIVGFLPDAVSDAIVNVFENIVLYLWYSGVQILIFLSAIQKINPSMYEAAKMDGASGWECFWKITLPTIKPMILLNAVYTIIFLSGNEQNTIIVTIRDTMFGSQGYGYASAMAWVYALVVTLMTGLIALLLMNKKDQYAKKVKLVKKEAKRQERMLKKAQQRGKKNAKKIAAYKR